MSTQPFLRSRIAWISTAAFCAAAPTLSLAATDSASTLLAEFEVACTDNVSGGGNGDFGNDNTDAAVDRAGGSALRSTTSKRVSAIPGSSFCNNLNSTTGLIDELNGNDEAARLAARAGLASDITPDEMPALYTSLVQLSADQIRNVSQHLRGRRSTGNDDSTTTAANGLVSYYGGNAGDGLSGRFSLFVDGAKVDGNQNQTGKEVGYDLDTDHFTVGVDYRISNALVAGFAYGNSDTTLEYSDAGNQTDNKTDHYILYASWYRDNFAVDTLLAYASGEFDTRRQILDSTAIGNTDNSITYFSVAGSYDFVNGALTWGTFASFDYLDGTIDAFAETSGGGWEVAFAKQDVKSQIYAMGLQANYAASFGWGVLVPHIRAEWRTELEDERDFIVGRFVQDPSSGFELAADDPDDNWYQVSAGASAQFAHGIAVFADYEEVLEYAETDLSTVTLGVRWEF